MAQAPGLFSAAGWNPVSAEEQLQQQRIAEQQQMIQNGLAVSGESPAARSASVLGSQLAGAIGGKYNPSQLPDEALRQQAIQDAGREAFTTRLAEAKKEGKDLSLDEQNSLLYSSMARAALEAGDMAAFSAISEEARNQNLATQLTRAKIREAEGSAVPVSRGDQVRNVITDAWSATQREAAKSTLREAQGYNRVVEGVSNTLETLVAAGEDPGIITGKPGALTGAIQEGLSLLRALPNIGGNVITGGTRNEEGELEGGESLSMDKMLERFHVEVPDIIAGSRERAMYKSLMIQLAYQQWRAQEGSGARQASDQDIERALDAIGAQSGDPRIVSSVLAQNHQNANAKLQTQRTQEYVTGDLYGLSRREVDAGLFGSGEKGWQDYDTRYQNAQSRLTRLANVPNVETRENNNNTITTQSGATIVFD